MFITAIELDTLDLQAERTFYTQTLGLPLTQANESSFTVQAGTTAPTFRSSGQKPLLYHFAFTVPFNKWRQAKAWLRARTVLLEGEGKDEFSNSRVRTHNLYFSDAAGDILEFIAREDLPSGEGERFDTQDMLQISEIGLVVDDVPATVRQLKTSLGIEVYRDSLFEDFAQIGDIDGVLVLVKKGRLWAPDELQAAVVSPLRVSVLGVLAGQFTLEPYPYRFDQVPLAQFAQGAVSLHGSSHH